MLTSFRSISLSSSFSPQKCYYFIANGVSVRPRKSHYEHLYLDCVRYERLIRMVLELLKQGIKLSNVQNYIALRVCVVKRKAVTYEPKIFFLYISEIVCEKNIRFIPMNSVRSRYTTSTIYLRDFTERGSFFIDFLILFLLGGDRRSLWMGPEHCDLFAVYTTVSLGVPFHFLSRFMLTPYLSIW